MSKRKNCERIKKTTILSPKISHCLLSQAQIFANRHLLPYHFFLLFHFHVDSIVIWNYFPSECQVKHINYTSYVPTKGFHIFLTKWAIWENIVEIGNMVFSRFLRTDGNSIHISIIRFDIFSLVENTETQIEFIEAV